MIDAKMRARWRFFRENAGWSTPPGRVVCAMRLARAETEAYARGWVVTWEEETDCFCAGDDVTCECDRRREENARNRWPALYQSVCICERASLYTDTETSVWEPPTVWPVDTLGGICGATPEYRRVVTAELCAEALYPEWQELERVNAFLGRIINVR